MATKTEITEQLDYYINLLIIQYNNKPKAKATISAFSEVLIAARVYFDVLFGYNIDTAVGAQLDVIGKYVGVNRYFWGYDLTDYFSLVAYSEGTPATPPRYGFTDYAGYDTTPLNGTLTYDRAIASNNRLSDDVFRVLVKLKLAQNYSDHSNASIDSIIQDAFSGELVVYDHMDMNMSYYTNGDPSQLVQAAIIKKALPHPMGVGAVLASGFNGTPFALSSYSDIPSDGHGFSTYADFDSLSASDLTYSNVTGV